MQDRTALPHALAAAAVLALVLAGCGGGNGANPEVPVTPTPTAPTDDPGPEGTDESGLLDVMSGNPTEIRLDGKKIGTTPISGYKVAPGTHDVTFVFSEDDTPTLTVQIEPGKNATVKLDPAPRIQESQKKDGKDGKDGKEQPAPTPKKP